MGFASWQRYCAASSSGRQPDFAALNRGRHLCSAGRPSRWALAHILACFCLSLKYLWNGWTDCAKFTGKHGWYLVPRWDVLSLVTLTFDLDIQTRSDEFKCQDQRSRSRETKTRCALPSPHGSVRMVCARCKRRESAAEGTIPSLPGRWFRGLACGSCLVKYL